MRYNHSVPISHIRISLLSSKKKPVSCKSCDTPHRVAVGAIVGVAGVDIATVEVQVVGVSTRNRSTPVVAVRTRIGQRTGSAIAIARRSS